MKVSDNLLKSISFYYTELTPAQYIIKSDIILFKNQEMILKSIQISDMIAKLTKAATTEAEKKFYNQESSVQEFNKALAKERKVNPGPATIKELIIGTGIVYPPCLKYFYNALTKGELTTIDIPKLAESIFITHKKLAELLSKLGGSTTQVTIAEIQTDLTSLNNKAKELYSKIKDTTTDVLATNKSISEIKETLDNILKNLQTNTTNTQDTEEIQQNLDIFYQEVNNNINKQVKEALEKQETTLKETVTKAITEQIKSTSTQALRSHTQNTLEDEIGSMLSTIKTNIEEDFSNARKSITNDRKLDDILKTVRNLTKKADTLADDPNLKELVEDLKKLATAIDGIETNNQGQTTLITSSIDIVKSHLNETNQVQGTTMEMEMDTLLDNVEDYFNEPSQVYQNPFTN